MEKANFFYVDYAGGFLTEDTLEEAKMMADRKAAEYGYAKVSTAEKNAQLLYEAGQLPEGYQHRSWGGLRKPS